MEAGDHNHGCGDSSPGVSRFQAFVDSAFDAYYDWHILSGRMEVSGQLANLLGIDEASLPTSFTEWLDHLHPDDREQTLTRNMGAAIAGTDYVGEYRLQRGDGSYMYVRDRGVILRDEAGRPAHMVGAFSDVSREREAEQVLREEAELYETLFGNAVNPAFQIAADGRFLDVNQVGVSLLQIDKETLLRQSVSSVWGPEAMAAVRASLASDAPATTVELELTIGDLPKALAVTLFPCRFRGERTCFALCTDVTAHQTLRRALEESEEMLRRQAESLEDANAALRVILDQRNRDREELERTIRENLETLVLPLLDRLQPHLDEPERICLEAAVRNLRELTRPFIGTASQGTDALLTPREREIANLVRLGRTSNEIAEALYISPTTVAHHRKNLRRKLGLPPRGVRLASHLAQSAAIQPDTPAEEDSSSRSPDRAHSAHAVPISARGASRR